jgi:hypothetical protein
LCAIRAAIASEHYFTALALGLDFLLDGLFGHGQQKKKCPRSLVDWRAPKAREERRETSNCGRNAKSPHGANRAGFFRA